MTQLNIHLTREFEATLGRFMRLRGIRTKSEAVRVAVAEGLQRAQEAGAGADFGAWLGLGRAAPENPDRRFRSDDDLWS